MRRAAEALSKPRRTRVVPIVSVCLAPLVAILSMVAPTYGAPITDPASGHTYEVISEQTSWFEAKTAAAGMGTASRFCHLATITSQAENDFVTALLGAADDSDFWLGGEQKDPVPMMCNPGDNDPSLWGIWITGEVWSFTNWESDEPDDCNELCLIINETGGWENEDCNATNEVGAYVVECEPEPTIIDPASGHSYQTVHMPKTWAEARATAQGMSTSEQSCHLATITTKAENDLVSTIVKDVDNEFWLGGQQRLPDPVPCENGDNDPSLWGTWITGEVWSFTNWEQPDEPEDCDEACLSIENKSNDGVWGNDDCSVRHGYVVECEPRRIAPALSSSALVILSLLMIASAWWALKRTHRGAH